MIRRYTPTPGYVGGCTNSFLNFLNFAVFKFCLIVAVCLSSVGICLKLTVALFMKLVSISSVFDLKTSSILKESEWAGLVL
jgi:hypothetical protein